MCLVPFNGILEASIVADDELTVFRVLWFKKIPCTQIWFYSLLFPGSRSTPSLSSTMLESELKKALTILMKLDLLFFFLGNSLTVVVSVPTTSLFWSVWCKTAAELCKTEAEWGERLVGTLDPTFSSRTWNGNHLIHFFFGGKQINLVHHLENSRHRSSMHANLFFLLGEY